MAWGREGGDLFRVSYGAQHLGGRVFVDSSLNAQTAVNLLISGLRL